MGHNQSQLWYFFFHITDVLCEGQDIGFPGHGASFNLKQEQTSVQTVRQ